MEGLDIVRYRLDEPPLNRRCLTHACMHVLYLHACVGGRIHCCGGRMCLPFVEECAFPWLCPLVNQMFCGAQE